MKLKKLLLTAALLYQSVMSFAQTSATFIINDLGVSVQSPLQCFTNNPLTLTDQSQGPVAICTILITDPNFTNVLYSTGAFNVNNSIGDIDLYDATSLPRGTTGTFGVVETVSSGPNDPNPSTYSGLITLALPTVNPATSSFTINNKAVSMQVPLVLNGPQTLELEYTGGGDVVTRRVDVLDENRENVLYTTDDVTGPMPSQIDMLNMCVGNQSGGCSSLNAQVTGTFVVRLSTSSTDLSGANVSIYEGLIRINPAIPPCNNQLTASFNIDNYPVSLQATPKFFNCNSLVLINTTSGPVAYHKISILNENQTEELYTTGYVQGGLQQVGLKDMIASAMKKNNSASGVLAVNLWESPCCPDDNVCASSYTGLIDFNPEIVPAPALFATSTVDNLNNQIVYSLPNTNVAAPDVVGRTTGQFFILNQPSSKTYVSSYTLELSKFDTSLFAWTAPVWTETIVNGDYFVKPIMIPISMLGGSGFLNNSTNAPDESKWKLNATLTNPCGNFNVTTMFKISDTIRQ